MNMKKSNTAFNYINNMLDEASLMLFKTLEGEYVGILPNSSNQMLSLSSKEFSLLLRSHLKKSYGIHLSAKDMEQLTEDYLEVFANENQLKDKLHKRIFMDDNNKVYYDLNENQVVILENGNARIEDKPVLMFKHTLTYDEQVTPNLSLHPEDLISLLEKHTNFRSKKDLHLFTLFLVAAFAGVDKYDLPLLSIVGEKGAAKTSLLRKIQMILDPGDISAIPKNNHDLCISLNNSFLFACDNVSSIPRKMSDTLCMAVTGGKYPARKLYTDSEQLYFDLKSLVVLTSVSPVIHQSDLLDRTILISLSRIRSENLRSQAESEKEFWDVLPDILGCCLITLAQALHSDVRPHDGTEFIRLCSFHKLAIKIGAILGFSQEYVDSLLWDNKRKTTNIALDTNVLSYCLELLLEEKPSYVNSVKQCWLDLKEIAQKNKISEAYLPGAPNRLSYCLNTIRSDLQYGAGITFDISNIGRHKQITITKDSSFK